MYKQSVDETIFIFNIVHTTNGSYVAVKELYSPKPAQPQIWIIPSVFGYSLTECKTKLDAFAQLQGLEPYYDAFANWPVKPDWIK